MSFLVVRGKQKCNGLHILQVAYRSAYLILYTGCQHNTSGIDWQPATGRQC